MARILTVLLTLTLLAPPTQAQTANLRQQQLYAGDIAELTIEYESKIPSLYAIDTSPLDADFEVLDTRSRIARVQRQNRLVHRMHWSVQMVPRRSGRLQVPSLRIGEHNSNTLWLDVVPADSEIQERQKVVVEIEAQPENPYPGQQTRIIMRLLHNLETLDGSLAEPKTGLWQVFRSGEDSRYRSQRGGESWSVLERSILLTPARAQQLAIPAASFRGRIDAADDSEDSRYIFRNSRALNLQLRPLPPGYGDEPWLPARQLQMHLARDTEDAPARVGDSIGVTLTLQADGLPGETLPAGLLLRASDGYRIYADRAERSTRVEGAAHNARLLGRLQQRFAIIPEQPGVLMLPRLKLGWWDVERDRARVATLDAISIPVAGSSRDANQGAHGNADASSNALRGRALPSRFVSRHWPWFALLLGVSFCAGVLYVARPQRQRLLAVLARARRRLQILERLRLACLGNDAAAARAAMLAWARIHWRDNRICGLHAIAVRTDTQAWRRQLRLLDSAVFAPGQRDWRGLDLWHLVKAQGSAASGLSARRGMQLPELYPQRQ